MHLIFVPTVKEVRVGVEINLNVVKDANICQDSTLFL